MILKSFLTNSSLEYQGNYEDLELWTKMFFAGAKFGNVDDIVIQYRVLENSLSTVHAAKASIYDRKVLKTFRAECKQHILRVVQHIDIKLLSEVEKSLVTRYLINRAITQLDIFGLYRLRGITLKNIIITTFSEIQRMFTK